MKLLGTWIGLNVLLGVIVFNGFFEFDHFWQEWEFLAAATAALYNLFFAVIVYAFHKQPHNGKTLHKTLDEGRSVVMYFFFRFGFPSLFFGLAAWVIASERAHGGGPVDASNVALKLILTLIAFAAVLLGDLVTRSYLQKRNHPEDLEWIRYFKRHAALVDLPLVVAYAALTVIFWIYEQKLTRLSNPREAELLLQAFVGGASALEMLILSALHGFAEFADQGTRRFQFRPTRA